MASSSSPSSPLEPLLYIRIRFSASIPDLQLPISSPTTTNTAALKRLIRSHLPAAFANRRIRLIHAGKALPDTTPLSMSLKLPHLLPKSSSQRNTQINSEDSQQQSDANFSRSKDKGKAPVHDPPTPHIYIHCSIGDVVLSAADLALEAAQADPSPSSSSSTTKATTMAATQQQQTHSTAPQPRGFDRLLAANFTPTEIAQLRSQFISNLALTHTPDSMPSPNTLRALEDRWLDSDANGGGTINNTMDDMTGGGEFEDGGGALRDMVLGAIIGFFWPVGAGLWLVREEGVWSFRRKLAVAVGVAINLLFGCIRLAH